MQSFSVPALASRGNNDANTGTRLDDITINGTVAPIPEPAAIWLALMGAGLVITRRRF